jgi:hypothetical protein
MQGEDTYWRFWGEVEAAEDSWGRVWALKSFYLDGIEGYEIMEEDVPGAPCCLEANNAVDDEVDEDDDAGERIICRRTMLLWRAMSLERPLSLFGPVFTCTRWPPSAILLA